jgi:hypothetical protein
MATIEAVESSEGRRDVNERVRHASADQTTIPGDTGDRAKILEELPDDREVAPEVKDMLVDEAGGEEKVLKPISGVPEEVVRLLVKLPHEGNRDEYLPSGLQNAMQLPQRGTRIGDVLEDLGC